LSVCRNFLKEEIYKGEFMHFYKFHMGDYKSATAHLSNEEDLAYRRLLDMYYDTEQPIPLETDWVARRLRVGSEVVATVLQDMFRETESGWVHDRCEEEIREYHRMADRARANGKAGGRPPKPTGNPVGTQQEPSRKLTTNHKPLTTNQIETKRTSAPVCPEGISLQVWNDYLAVRKAKRSPLTATALTSIEKEAGKAGWSLEKALSECAARGWIGFKAEWVDKLSTQKLSFAERDELLKRKKYEEMTGRPWPEDDVAPAATWELLK
jgi:uncharacterized protein YdaU (DUF1376 family)